MNPLQRVLAIHDLSGIGKCSLTVILPILSTMGIEVGSLPTAVLSTHTGDIVGYTYRDLTDDLLPMTKHWQSLGITFDAVYSGWLGSSQQAEIVLAIFDMFHKPGTLCLVDPVMGDHGRLYSTYTPDRVQGMVELCARAEIITPNLTEACFLLGEPCRDDFLHVEALQELCLRLTKLGPQRIVLTGIATSDASIGAASLDLRTSAFDLHEMPRLPGIWHGTGDVFCAVLLGAVMRGYSLSDATRLAVLFTQESIARTHQVGKDPRLGVDFERVLPDLVTMLHGDGYDV